MTSNVFNMFNQQQIQEFNEAFKFIDQDNDGIISFEDVREIFLSLGKELSEDEVQKMVEEAPGPINFTMFLTLLGQKMRETDPLDTLEQAFSCLDENGTGRLHRSDFEFMMMNIGDRYNQQQFDDLLRDVEVAEDGTFDYKELARVMKYGNAEL
ncbi:Oidioi.mRNA.OKI2018_I69.chr2.g4166.t1.cds [Oikopleura dioica]|uniref:Oidioi.mRNA.OKI2018_I69.chr2.g4166.t1.cds n=1 Tax=Oikopleura dioica TaxID=34765 RepID=A0ABN7T0P2_OIKDI|nr:Oidioi.mRNA.OKI2018_I69.chr2.g4166.t1.cds [Oikopleura dioica]